MNPRVMSPFRILLLLLIALLLPAIRAQAQHAYRQLREFGFVERSAEQPLSGVVEGPDNWLYGTSFGGNGGVIYRVKKDGTGFSVIFDFNGTNGLPARGSLIFASDGALYGTSLLALGPALYRIQPDGTGFTLHALPIDAPSVSGVIEGRDGRLYGTTWAGDMHSAGTIFAIKKDGSGFTVLHSFAGGAGDGQQPVAAPLQGSDGQLYVATREGGSAGAGTVCRVSTNGVGFFVLHHFPASGTNDGRMPNSALAEGPGGYLYGTTGLGGIGGDEDFFAGFGVVYRVSNDGDIYSVVRRFEGTFNDGQTPRNVFVGADGRLYGTAQNAGYARNVDALFRMDIDGNNFGLIYTWVTFDNQTIRLNRIIESADGRLYGTSAAGGASNLGQVFKFRPNGTEYQNLHEFSAEGGDGNLPWTLIRDADGALYGSTLSGGANNSGTIYKLETTGAYRVLHHFATETGWPLGLLAASDGFLYGSSYYSHDIFRLAKDGTGYIVLTNLLNTPVGSMIEGTDFLLYGVTDGSVFRLNPDGTSLEEIHSFTNISSEPVTPAGVIEGSDGKLYGTSRHGGASDQGMVFKMNKDGSQYQVLYSFVAPSGNIVWPNPLFEASDGYLYGTTYRGGEDSEGMIYRISKAGAYNFITAFTAGKGNPVGALAEGPGGWLYGVTQESGNFQGGHLFRFKIGGASTIYILHHFGEGNLGRDPGTGVVLDPAGAIYGTTQYGGFGSGFGTIFRVDVRPILSIRPLASGMELSWPNHGDTYNLQVTHNLGLPFNPYNTGTTNTGERITATVPKESGARFYRLQQAQ